jgi:hypothetical protein
MWNIPTEERLAKIPKLYDTEKVPLKEKLMHLHFFSGGCDWYIAEYDAENDLFWGFAILNSDYEMAEWGYISFKELKEIRINGMFEIDCELEEYWKPKKAIEIEKICIAQGWSKSKSVESQNVRIPPADDQSNHFQGLNHYRGGQ